MRAVILDISPEVIAERHRKDLDRKDEVWEGVYHMAPPPDEEHQVVVDDSFGLFWSYVKRHHLGVIRSNKGVRDIHCAEENYRVPEWVFLRAGREHLLKEGGSYVDEGPDVVIEVRSPGDETYDKIPFYEKVGVLELVIVDRDTRAVQVLRRIGERLTPVSPNADGWAYCEGLKVFFRAGTANAKPVLRVLLELDRTEHAF